LVLVILYMLLDKRSKKKQVFRKGKPVFF